MATEKTSIYGPDGAQVDFAAAIGLPTDAPWTGSGPASLISVMKAVALSGVSSGSGTGSGTGTGTTTTAPSADFSKASNSQYIAALAA